MQKRLNPRWIVCDTVPMRLVLEEGKSIFPLSIIDVSPVGACVQLDRAITMPSNVQLRFDGLAPKSSITTTAEIRRHRLFPGNHGGKDIHHYGLSFSIPDEWRQRLNALIESAGKDGLIHEDRRKPARINNGFLLNNPKTRRTYLHGHEDGHLKIRTLSHKDLETLCEIETNAWGEEMGATREMLETRLDVFREGMIGAFDLSGQLNGWISLIVIKHDSYKGNFTWMDVSDGGYTRGTHDPTGDCLYGISLTVRPSAPKNTSAQLIKAGLKLSIRRSLRGIIAGCRIPAYHKHASKFSIDDYILVKTKTGRFLDPELSAYHQLDGVFTRPLPNYFVDPESLNYGVFCFLANPLYNLQKGEFPFSFERITVQLT